jgi:hypothetical protein
MDNPHDLRQLADKCRRLAGTLTDVAARDGLNSLAAEYQERAAAADKSLKSGLTIGPTLPPRI